MTAAALTPRIGDAQRDVRDAHLLGGTGMVVSGLIWLASGVVALLAPPATAMLALFLGGIAIFPLSMLVNRALGRSGLLAPGNPLGALAGESTAAMVLCMPLAFIAARVDPALYFPAMMALVGAHYLPFATLFGHRIYWALGGAMIAAAYLLVLGHAPFALGAFVGGAIEIAFAPLAYAQARREARAAA